LELYFSSFIYHTHILRCTICEFKYTGLDLGGKIVMLYESLEYFASWYIWCIQTSAI